MTYLIVHGEVEVAPGRFEPGIVSSRPCADRAAAEREWARALSAGLYEVPFERPEYVEDAPTLGTLIGDSA
jgi:hypothetical protein